MEETPWDRSLDEIDTDTLFFYEKTTFEPIGREDPDGRYRSGGSIEIVLDAAEYSAVRGACVGEEIPTSILGSAKRGRDGFRMVASARNTKAFHDYLMDAVGPEENPSLVQLMGQAISKLNKALDAYLDEIF